MVLLVFSVQFYSLVVKVRLELRKLGTQETSLAHSVQSRVERGYDFLGAAVPSTLWRGGAVAVYHSEGSFIQSS